MADVLDALVQDYEQRLAKEKAAYQEAGTAQNTALRNIDRIEGAMVGVKDAIAKLNSTVAQSVEDNDAQQDIEASD
jgi:hypothetical protein